MTIALCRTSRGRRLRGLEATAHWQLPDTEHVGLVAGRRRLAFWSRVGAMATLMHLAPTSGIVGRTQLTVSGEPPEACWRDEDTIVTCLSDDGALVVAAVAVDTGEVTALLRTGHAGGSLEAPDPTPRASLTGDLLLLAPGAESHDILLLRSGRTSPQVLMRGRRNAVPVGYAWSPTGRTIVVNVERPFGTELLMLDLQSGLLEHLAVEEPTGEAAWSPDGTTLVVGHRSAGAAGLAAVDLPSRATTTVDVTPIGEPRSPMFLGQDTIACIGTSPSNEPALFLGAWTDGRVGGWHAVPVDAVEANR